MLISSHYLSHFGGSCTEKGHLASRVADKNFQRACIPAECSNCLTSVLPGHADSLWTNPPLQLQLPHHHQTLTGCVSHIVNNMGTTAKHRDEAGKKKPATCLKVLFVVTHKII